MNAAHLSKPTDALKLTNGVRIPCLGFGTWQSQADMDAIDALGEFGGAGLDPDAVEF